VSYGPILTCPIADLLNPFASCPKPIPQKQLAPSVPPQRPILKPNEFTPLPAPVFIYSYNLELAARKLEPVITLRCGVTVQSPRHYAPCASSRLGAASPDATDQRFNTATPWYQDSDTAGSPRRLVHYSGTACGARGRDQASRYHDSDEASLLHCLFITAAQLAGPGGGGLLGLEP
jgi:hypothetical protein